MYTGRPRLSGWLGPKKFPNNWNPVSFGTTVPRIEIPIIAELLL